MTLRTDHYTARQWASLRDVPSRDAVAAAVPEGHTLSVTHGGSQYRASLLRDGEVVDERRDTFLRNAVRLVPLRTCFVCERRPEDVTVDVDGVLLPICDTCYQRRQDDRSMTVGAWDGMERPEDWA